MLNTVFALHVITENSSLTPFTVSKQQGLSNFEDDARRLSGVRPSFSLGGLGARRGEVGFAGVYHYYLKATMRARLATRTIHPCTFLHSEDFETPDKVDGGQAGLVIFCLMFLRFYVAVFFVFPFFISGPTLSKHISAA